MTGCLSERMIPFASVWLSSCWAIQAMAEAIKPTATVTYPPELSEEHDQHPTMTTPPSLEELKRRQDVLQGTVYYAPDNVCGYVSGSSIWPWSCDTTDTCVFGIESGGYVACCHSATCSSPQRRCVDAADIAASKCDSSCLADDSVQKCTGSSLPFCGTMQFNQVSSILDYQCASTNASTRDYAYLTYFGQQNNVTLSTHVIGLAFVGETSTTTNSTTTTTPQTVSPTPSPSQEPTQAVPVGKVVGGAVGGTAGVVVIAALVYWFFWRQQPKPTRIISINPYTGKPELPDVPVTRQTPIELPCIPQPVELDGQRGAIVQEAPVSEPRVLRASR